MKSDRWIRVVAPVWQLAYVLVHLWWVAGPAPRFLTDEESYFPGGWVPVVLGSVALVGCLRPFPGLAVVAGLGLCVYSFLFPVIVVSLLFEGVRTGAVASLLATGSGVVGGVLCLRLARDERRRVGGRCGSCGRVHGRSPESRAERAPGWAFAGAYVAVAGFAARVGVWVADVVAGRWPSPESRENGVSPADLLVFVGLMSLAGTVLPLALAHRWGRIWPAWVAPLRGRAVPRWLVLGPGLFVGASLTAYFGIAGMTAWVRGDIHGPFLPLLLEMVGYTLWGVGLLVASASHLALTRRPCARPTF